MTEQEAPKKAKSEPKVEREENEIGFVKPAKKSAGKAETVQDLAKMGQRLRVDHKAGKDISEALEAAQAAHRAFLKLDVSEEDKQFAREHSASLAKLLG